MLPEDVRTAADVAALLSDWGAHIWAVFFQIRVGRGTELEELTPAENEGRTGLRQTERGTAEDYSVTGVEQRRERSYAAAMMAFEQIVGSSRALTDLQPYTGTPH